MASSGSDSIAPEMSDVHEVMEAGLLLGADSVDLAEAWNPNRFGKRAKAFGLTPGVALDLRLGWDLGDEKQQREATELLERQGPYLLILSPMCGGFSALRHLG
eukprot:4878699-Amphidinium_carterae.1